MKLFNIVYLTVLLVLAIFGTAFNVQSKRSDAYMMAQINAQDLIPHLKPLTVRSGLGPFTSHRRYIRDTSENRKIYHAYWIIRPGDGYLYSAWWE